ncbi:hypothetical protein AC579_6228, partial [Pseudocercospora musae]
LCACVFINQVGSNSSKMLLSNFFLVAMASLALAKPVEKNPNAAARAASILGAVLMPRYSCAATCSSSADCSGTCSDCSADYMGVNRCGH